MSTKKVMGLDVSTHTGFALLDANDPVEPMVTGVISSEKKGIARVYEMGKDLEGIVLDQHPDLIVFEGFGYANTNSLVTLVEIATYMKVIVFMCNIPMVVVAPPSLKKFVLQKGVGKKDMMRLEVYKRWGFEDDSDDVIDAYALAMVGVAALTPDANWTNPQRDVMKLISKQFDNS